MAQSRRNGSSHRSRTVVMAKPARASTSTPARGNGRTPGPSATALIHELGSCVTEADLVQVLYRGLHGRFGYDVINLQVLEREGWYHSLPMDAGVLQDVRRRPVRESMFARQFANPKTTVMPVDTLEMVTLPEGTDRARYMQMVGDSLPTSRWLTARSAHTVTARDVVAGNKPVLAHYPHSSLWVPLKESGGARGALGINFSRPYAYEASTGAFMELVADEVTLSLRNARSYEAIEDQRRRLEVVNAVGRRLASSLDRWSIMRTLREELSANLKFDGFILATITDGPDGPIAEGYQYVAGVEEVVPPVALAVTGPSREAYETGKPILVRNNPWRRSFEEKGLQREVWTVGRGAAVFVSGPPDEQRKISRSFVWVPVLSGERITAMLSLQSYTEGAFDDWHVKLLQDVAAHVSLALANADHFAQAQTERARLEALHLFEMGVAGASDERELSEAVFKVAGDYLESTHMVLA